jgi:hypothetical protein
LSTLVRLLASLADRRYDPGRHYMRGPGPATRARQDRESHAAPAARKEPENRR